MPPEEIELLTPEDREPDEPGGPEEEWKVRSIPLGLAIFLLILVGAAAVGVGSSVERLLEEEEAVLEAWEGVRDAVARRHDLLAGLVDDLIRAGASPPEALRWRQVRERYEGSVSLAEEVRRLPELDAASDALEEAIRGSRERLPADGERLLEEFREVEGRRRIARRTFNEAAERWRVTLSRIPTRWLGGLLGFEAVPAYAEPSS